MHTTITARLVAALQSLEQANEDLCAVRSDATYQQMLADGNAPALMALDKARQEARNILLEAVDGGWLEIDDDARSGDDVLLYFPLEGLAEHHPRIVIGYWSRDKTSAAGGRWVFQNRATRGYSEDYQPTRYQPLEPPASAGAR